MSGPDVTTEQRGYLWGEIYPAFAYGIDRLLDAADLPLRLFTPEDVHFLFKRSMGIPSTERLKVSEVADYISTIQALAAECLIFVATPEEWHRGIDERERQAFYDLMFGKENS